jgi:hypothetical protein
MARPRQFALVLLCGTVTIAGWCAARLGGFEWSAIENTAAPIWNRGAARGATILSADTGPVGELLAHAMASVAAATTSHRKLAEPAVASAAASPTDAARVDPGPRETAFGLAGVSAAEAPVEAPLPDSRPTPPPETRVRLVSLFRPDPVEEDPQAPARPVETFDECLVVDICIDEYL